MFQSQTLSGFVSDVMVVHCILTSNVKFVSSSSHVTAVVAVPATRVFDLSVVNPEDIFRRGITTVRVVRKPFIDVNVNGASVGPGMRPVHSTGPCRVTPHQNRLALLLRDTTILVSCC